MILVFGDWWLCEAAFGVPRERGWDCCSALLLACEEERYLDFVVEICQPVGLEICLKNETFFGWVLSF